MKRSQKAFVLFFLLLGIASHSQTSKNIISNRVQYTSNEGYHIIAPTTAVYDHLGWLWITGNNADNQNFLFENQEIVIQRFDGISFYDVPLPETDATIINAFLFQDNSRGLYMRIDYKDKKTDLYHINPETQVFTLIENYIEVDGKYGYVTSFNLNGELTFVHCSKDEVALIKIEDYKAVVKDTVPFEYNANFSFSNWLSHDGEYTFLRVMDGVHYVVKYNGTFVKKITLDDYDFQDNQKPIVLKHLNYACKIDGKFIYSSYDQPNIFLEFDEENFRLKQVDTHAYKGDDILHWEGTSDKYLYTYALIKEGAEFKVINKNTFKIEESFQTDGFHVIAGRDLNKEVVLLYENSVDRILFNQNKIETYLKGESIRAMLEISEDLYLISTDNKGIFELNTRTGETKKIKFTYKGKEVFITEPREIIKTSEGYIFNDTSNLYEVNSNYQVKRVHNHPLWLEETIQVGDKIFKGGVHHLGMLAFDMQTKTYDWLEDYTFQTREFATNGTDLYIVSVDKGFFIYQNGTFSNLLPENEVATNLLSIFYSELYGVLISTKQGKIYAFDLEKQEFELFYEDKLKASIVGMILDDSKVLWLNTYAGIVSFNPETKQEKRYTKKDGIYELEGNRYSTYKDSKGNLFIGSFKGLSVFNPQELTVSEKDVNLQFSELSFYNKDNKEWTTHRDLNYIKSQNEITLPSFNQRFSAKVSLLDIVNHKNFKYRYRLNNDAEKENSDWSSLFLENEIVFSNLSAGNYTLQVEALTAINQNQSNLLEMKIVSEKIFYRTWWFTILVLLSIISFFGYLFYQFKSKQRLYAANQIAMNEAKIKEAMMLEIHHRIKNNLQVVSGLLSIQAFNSNNPELKSKLKDSQGRIESIAGIHNILYKGDSQEDVLVEEYFNDIITYNKTLFTIPVVYVLDIHEVTLSMDKAIPLALTLNELINNSHKHAFQNTDEPRITVSFKKDKDDLIFDYQDNGQFKVNSEERVSMGMKIINMMISQLKGEVEFLTDKSFRIKIRIKLSK